MNSEPDSVNEEICLLAQTGAGDREAFRQLYARYAGPLLALGVRMVGDHRVAEELLQDAFVKVWQHAGEYDARKSRPFTWVVTIMRRTCIDHLRKRHGPDPAAVEEAAGIRSEGETPREAALAHEDADRVAGALASMPAHQRGALELALFSGLSHAEISRRLVQPIGTVKSWIRRGLIDLRAALHHPAS